MPLPSAHRRCVRYTRAAERCPNTTARKDGWCGECDGYPDGQFTARDDDWLRRHTSWFMHARALPPTPRPLDSEEAYEVPISHTAQQHYAQIHGTTPAAAEAQIRSLLEDLLLKGQCTKGDDGCVCLFSLKHGYGLLLGRDLRVIAYRTRHRERTWAQVRAGVTSRISKKNRRENPLLPLLPEDAPVKVTHRAADEYLGLVGGAERVPPDDIAPTAASLTDRIHALVVRMPAELGRHDVTMQDGSAWTVVVDPATLERPVLIRITAPESSPPR